MTTVDPTTGRPYDPDIEPMRPDASLGDLLGELTGQMGDLFRQEVELAKVEAKQEAKRAGAGVGMFGAAGAVGLTALIIASIALAELIDQALNRALSFALVALAWVIVAAVLMRSGKAKLAAVKPLPETTESLKEDAQWIKTQNS